MKIKDNSPVIGFYATVADPSIGSVGYYPVVDGDVDGARRLATEAQDAWARIHGSSSVGPAWPTPHTKAESARDAAIVAAYDPSALRTPRERAMRRGQRQAGARAHAEVIAKYA